MLQSQLQLRSHWLSQYTASKPLNKKQRSDSDNKSDTSCQGTRFHVTISNVLRARIPADFCGNYPNTRILPGQRSERTAKSTSGCIPVTLTSFTGLTSSEEVCSAIATFAAYPRRRTCTGEVILACSTPPHASFEQAEFREIRSWCRSNTGAYRSQCWGSFDPVLRDFTAQIQHAFHRYHIVSFELVRTPSTQHQNPHNFSQSQVV